MTIDPKFCPATPLPDALAVSHASYERLKDLVGTAGCPVVEIRDAQRASHADLKRARLRQFVVNGVCFELLVIDEESA